MKEKIGKCHDCTAPQTKVNMLSRHILELQADKGRLTDRVKELEQQIKKMKCCSNCKYWFCNKSSISIDENENRTVHKWNEEKQAYCDVGIKGKYQCWELAE